MRALIGMGLATAGLTFFVYGLQQAIEGGSCGTGYTAACPSGTGPMIVAMVFGMFVALAGAGIAGVILRFIPVIFISAIAAVVLALVDLNENDTRPGLEALAAVVVPMVLICVPGLGRRRTPNNARVVNTEQMREMAQQMAQAQAPQPPMPQPAASFGTPPQWKPRNDAPKGPVNAEEIASRLRQLDQLKESGLLGESEYAERRKQILAEL
jgi:hypothetical protein